MNGCEMCMGFNAPAVMFSMIQIIKDLSDNIKTDGVLSFSDYCAHWEDEHDRSPVIYDDITGPVSEKNGVIVYRIISDSCVNSMHQDIISYYDSDDNLCVVDCPFEHVTLKHSLDTDSWGITLTYHPLSVGKCKFSDARCYVNICDDGSWYVEFEQI